jgi:hypothetical protein
MKNEPWVSLDMITDNLIFGGYVGYRWIDDRELRTQKVGRFWNFKASEVD